MTGLFPPIPKPPPDCAPSGRCCVGSGGRRPAARIGFRAVVSRALRTGVPEEHLPALEPLLEPAALPGLSSGRADSGRVRYLRNRPDPPDWMTAPASLLAPASWRPLASWRPSSPWRLAAPWRPRPGVLHPPGVLALALASWRPRPGIPPPPGVLAAPLGVLASASWRPSSPGVLALPLASWRPRPGVPPWRPGVLSPGVLAPLASWRPRPGVLLPWRPGAPLGVLASASWRPSSPWRLGAPWRPGVRVLASSSPLASWRPPPPGVLARPWRPGVRVLACPLGVPGVRAPGAPSASWRPRPGVSSSPGLHPRGGDFDEQVLRRIQPALRGSGRVRLLRPDIWRKSAVRAGALRQRARRSIRRAPR